VTDPREVEALLRAHAPQALGVLVRRYQQFDHCEDALQEALLAGYTQWVDAGVPEHPLGWLVTVATRRLTDQWRSESARRRREVDTFSPVEDVPVPGLDDTLTLLLLCCHPALSPVSQAALTLRAVGGLTTAEIAGAFLVPEATMAQRISRAKARIREVGATFELPADVTDRLRVVLAVLYLVFNEGYTATSGAALSRVDLTTEAIRLTRELIRQAPNDLSGEVAGLLALMLLTDARRPARLNEAGELIPLTEQDRLRWNGKLIEEGVELLTATLPHSTLGPYQLQAAIAAVHAEAPSAEETDWPQILLLYDLLERFSPSPMVTLNRAVALAMAQGPAAGLALLASLEDRLANHHRLHAVRAHLQELTGDLAAARASYREAAKRTASLPEQRYLTARAARLAPEP
jgi:predicted RNA polymerase sigma factor